MRMSREGLLLLMQWEGVRTRVYDDAGGRPTIGVGHLLTEKELEAQAVLIDGSWYKYRYGLSKENVQKLLAQDIRQFEDVVNGQVKAKLDQNQFDALVSFCFNVGVGAFLRSTLLQELKAHNLIAVPTELRRWTRVGDKVVPGLVKRRENEIRLWLTSPKKEREVEDLPVSRQRSSVV
jgi:lysozyme